MLRLAWFKGHIGLLSAVAIVLGSFAFLAILISEQGLFIFPDSHRDMNPVLTSFRQAHNPLVEINFWSLYGGSGQFQVLHPLLDMTSLQFKKENLACDENGAPLARLGYGQGAPVDEPFPQAKQADRKWDQLNQLLMQKNSPSDDFVTTPPFVDDRGDSYAYLLNQNFPAPFNQRAWVEQHLSFFKISELAKILEKYQIDDLRYSTISKLSESEMEDVIRGVPLVLTKDYLLLKNQSRFGFSPLSYWVYDIRDFRAELKNSKYELSAYTAGSVCLQRVGNACWTYSSKDTMAYLYRYSVAILVLIGLFVFTILGFFFKHMYQKNKEQLKNRLALQVLSHEFRTPVSSMLLMMDQLSKNQFKYDVVDQDLMTRISTEIFRLQRIIEMSRTYLQTESHRVHFKSTEIPSINNWICDFISETNPQVQTQLLSSDQSLEADPFWLKFVLSNLVQNAFLHGKSPVFIRLQNKEKKLKITVEDQGECEFGSLKEMTDAFVKSSRSKGMGLGLNISKFILDDWGTEIQFSKSPTAFSLLLSESRRG